MRAAVWVYAICLSISGMITGLQGLNNIRRDIMRGDPEPILHWVSWSLFAAGMAVLLLSALGTYSVYAQRRPWQLQRAGTLAPIGVGWVVAGVLVIPVSFIGVIGVTVGEYQSHYVTGDPSWSISAWVAYWSTYAIAAVFAIAGGVLFAFGARQYRADASIDKELGGSQMSMPKAKGRVLSVGASNEGSGLDQVVVETGQLL